eukprot:g36168.t1
MKPTRAASILRYCEFSVPADGRCIKPCTDLTCRNCIVKNLRRFVLGQATPPQQLLSPYHQHSLQVKSVCRTLGLGRYLGQS